MQISFPWQFWVLIGGIIAFPLVQRIIRELVEQHRFARAGLQDVTRMSGRDFEKYLDHLFRGLGYRVELTPASSDYGVDLILTDGAGRRIAVQAKRWKQKVGVEALQQVIGGAAYYKCHETLVVTTSRFTGPAVTMARETRTQLWSIKELGDAMDQVHRTGGVPTRAPSRSAGSQLPRPQVQRNTGASQPLGTPAKPGAPVCPQCGSSMAKRLVYDRQIWICSQFPKCRGNVVNN